MAEAISKNKKPVVEKIFPRPVRKVFRTLNYHFTEHGRIINHVAKTLPPQEKAAVVEHGKRFCVARAKKNLPSGVRNVATSLVIGQGMWYFVCPMISEIPGIRESTLGWLAWGGSDKLFVASDQLLFTTDMVGGYSSEFAGKVANAVPRTVAFGGAMLAAELATDISRCWIEYWTQKKYGIVPDAVARAYGQTRPFPVRYSTLEVYQKAISYVLRPWTIGTPQQIFSSIQGTMGSLWRAGPQLALVVTVGRAIDKFFKKIAQWTGLSKIGERIRNSAEEAEKAAMRTIEFITGEKKFLALEYMLAADSRKMWKWNPFKPALSLEKAERAAEIASRVENIDMAVAAAALGKKKFRTTKDEFLGAMAECLADVTDIFGRKMLMKTPEYKSIMEVLGKDRNTVEMPEAAAASDQLHTLMESLRTERVLR